MPRNKTSDDIDHVRPDPKTLKASKKKASKKKKDKVLKKPVPEPGPMPEYTPMVITNPLTYGQSKLPDHIDPLNPYAIFNLFFNESILQTLANHTNEYANLYPGAGANKPFARPWHATTVKELRAYIGVYIWMGVH